jgi:UDP-glucose:glycoprotein glucosyltransferase
MAPFLKIVRDELQLPLAALLVPPPILQSDSNVPITSYYRFVADPVNPKAYFSHLPANHVLTLRTDVPEPWDVQQTSAVQDTDNLRCDLQSGCGDDAKNDGGDFSMKDLRDQAHLTTVVYALKSLLVFGQCYESKGGPPNGLQLTLVREADLGLRQLSARYIEVGMDGALLESPTSHIGRSGSGDYSDTLVMKNVGYWQLRANPGLWTLSVAKESKGATLFDMVDGEALSGRLVIKKEASPKNLTKMIVLKDFVNRGEFLVVERKPGVNPKASLFYDEKQKGNGDEDDTIHVFSLATGHLYERFLKIMMLSVTKRTSSKVKFWLFENFLSPTFKSTAKAMSERIGCEVEFVTYKWPEWLRGQSEKQRIIWGYKILFLDVLFPLNVTKIIYVDADQVVRGDLKELWDMDLKGAPYGYTPFCSSREETLGYQFWREGFWKTHLRGKPYHISALYVVDLDLFRRLLVGDQLRSIYQQLSADPGSLSNLDQDLPNYAQHSVPIFSLPQEWLWCESWCSDESKAAAKTIDLCNNPMHKEPKVLMAKRVIDGPLFEESWVELDAEVERYEELFTEAHVHTSTN